MRFTFEVLVRLKTGLLDPQGKAVEGALPALGWTNVSSVRVGKHVELTVDAGTEAAARAQVEEMAARLLANPVIEDFVVLSADGGVRGAHEGARGADARAIAPRGEALA